MSDQIAARREISRHSPCIGICKLDERTGHCLGCARTGDEIARWSGMGEAERDGIWTLLPARFAALSLHIRLLPWTADEIAAWVATTVRERRGTWVTGMPGALAEFPCTPPREIVTHENPEGVVARAEDGAFSLTLHDKLRAFAFASDGPIVLGLPKTRLALPSAATLTEIGPDVAALDARHRSDVLFDMGLGRQSSRFGIRSGDGRLTDALRRLCGRPWPEVMYEAGMQIIAVGPHRVVESTLARVEIYTPIPLPGGTSPPGAHTHFLPEFLKSGEEIPAGLALPDFALPIAVFYPGGGLP